MPRAEHLAAGLGRVTVGERHGLDTTTGTVTRFHHQYVRSGELEVARGAQTRQSSAQYSDIDHARRLLSACWLC
jgi:hypothetical protein